MKLSQNTILTASVTLMATVVSSVTSLSQSAHAEEARFFCGTSNGHPTTMAKTSSGDVPFIVWSSNYFANSGWTPQRRCDEVSKRFQDYYTQGSLKYLTTGTANNMPIICPAIQQDGPCAKDSKGNTAILITLRQDDRNPGRTLEQLLQVRNRASGPLYQSTERPYFSVEEVLELRAAEAKGISSPSAAPSVTPGTTQPRATTPSSSTPSAGGSQEGLW